MGSEGRLLASSVDGGSFLLGVEKFLLPWNSPHMQPSCDGPGTVVLRNPEVEQQ